MAINLTAGAISKLMIGEWKSTDPKPVLQVIDIQILQPQAPDGSDGGASDGKNKKMYLLLLSDGSFHQYCVLNRYRSELITSHQLQKGSIVQLTEFFRNFIRDRFVIIILGVNLILGKCDIIGDPKKFLRHKTAIKKESPSENTPSENLGDNILAVAKDVSKIEKMMREMKKEDDMGACIEKLEKLGWGTGTPMYDTALFLFGESADYRKLWLHLKPESCGNWVRNAGTQFGLLG